MYPGAEVLKHDDGNFYIHFDGKDGKEKISGSYESYDAAAAEANCSDEDFM